MKPLRLLTALVLAAASASAQLPELPVVSLPEGGAASFVVLVREPGPQGLAQVATIWFVDPGRQAAGRWRVLGESPWAATPLVGSPRLLRWQVPARRERVRVLRLCAQEDGTCTVEELLRGARLRVHGATGDKVLVEVFAAHDTDQFVLDAIAGPPRELVRHLQVLATHGADWLVVVDGELARFDAAKEQVVRRYEGVAVEHDDAQRAEVDWDGGRFAVRRGGFVDAQRRPVEALPFAEPSIVYRALTIWDLDAGTHREVCVRTQAQGGSGVPVIPIAMETELVGGLLRYTERRPAEGASKDLDELDWGRDMEWVTIDVATGEEVLRRPYEPRQLLAPELPPDQRVPEALRERVAESPIRAWGLAQDVAWAFLVEHGTDLPLAKDGVVKLDAACRTADGERLLVLHRSRFYLCDLVADTVVQWPAPPELAAAHAVELCELSAR
ncbi:MAG: hypothetical protein H6835_14690 [Planctomycetes bacterium]|nr:hypothetical protein [Planctomycetota bacterium]